MMMEIQSALDAPPAAAGLDPLREPLPALEIQSSLDAQGTAARNLDPGIREPLPALVMGDVGVETARKHEWPGRLFIALSAAAALGVGVMAIVSAVWGVNGAPSPALGVAGGVWTVLQWRLTREVRRFSRWGWYGAMVELGGAAAAKVWAMAQGNVVGGAIGLCIDVLWMKYFWDRRDQFDVDTSL
jgi:hypothetical protein